MPDLNHQPNLTKWIKVLRVCIGIVYLWFGALKFFPGLSPAEDLAKNTIHLLTFGAIPEDLSLTLLAIWETLVGLMLIIGFAQRLTISIVVVHMVCTFVPLFVLPAESFTSAPFALTLVGQYIVKNLIIINALLVIRASLQPQPAN